LGGGDDVFGFVEVFDKALAGGLVSILEGRKVGALPFFVGAEVGDVGVGLVNGCLGGCNPFRLRFLGKAGRLELRGEFLNAFNRVNLESPVGDLSNTLFVECPA
jgi:hypothetical protein